MLSEKLFSSYCYRLQAWRSFLTFACFVVRKIFADIPFTCLRPLFVLPPCMSARTFSAHLDPVPLNTIRSSSSQRPKNNKARGETGRSEREERLVMLLAAPETGRETTASAAAVVG